MKRSGCSLRPQPGGAPGRLRDYLGVGEAKVPGDEADCPIIGSAQDCFGNRFRLVHHTLQWR
jgi:hypothetical protein